MKSLLAKLRVAAMLALIGAGALVAGIELGVIPYPGSPSYFRLLGWFIVATMPVYALVIDRRIGVPSHATPLPDVRSLFNHVTEGILLLNEQRQIVLANDAFAKVMGCSATEMQGRHVDDLMGIVPAFGKNTSSRSDQRRAPWDDVFEQKRPLTGVVLQVRDAQRHRRSLLVNLAPMLGVHGDCVGVLIGLDDISEIQSRNVALREMLEKLETSRTQIRQQNEELRQLATRDPLTGCFNRRAFFDRSESLLNHAIRFGNHFGCILLDVDHFKSLNDQHGHAMGDEVLKGVATRIQGQIRQSDILCRYGGEEFCLLLIDQKIAQTTAVAERIRQCLSETPINGQQVTASLGVTTTEFHVTDTQRLIQRADEALYAAKRSGRNRVCRWDQIAAVDLSNDEVAPRAVSHFGEEHFPWIPFHTVQAVFSLLLLRSLPVAEHCRRVADACVLAGENLLSAPDLYLVEVAALLHEIGKMGLPDALLLKRGAMTPDDQQIIEFYERVGCDLLQAAFDCAQLDAAVAAVRRGKQRQRLSVDDLTPAARLLVIADEYDQLTYDRDGRRQLADDLACQQLKRLADPRLDPRLVNYFADRVAAREAIRGTHHPHVNLQPLSEIESNILNELKSIHDQLREREIVTESTIRALSQLGR